MKTEILTIDKPNKNNRIYTREVVEKMLKTFKPQADSKRLMVSFNESLTLNLDITKAAGIVNDIKIEGDKLVADIELLHTPAGLKMQESILVMEQAGLAYKVTTVGSGKLVKNENGNEVVTDYEPEYLNFYIDSII
jgi:hypothetical protein